MPHFENLDKYEAKNPKSGKRNIVPIAPHSLQAADYHPGDGGTEPPRKRKRIGEFKKMDFEPVSIRQMEKEFKAAGRKRRRSISKLKRGSLMRRIKRFFASLFGKKNKKPQRNRHRNKPSEHGGKPRNRKHSRQRGEQKGKPKGQHQNSRQGNKRRSGKPHSNASQSDKQRRNPKHPAQQQKKNPNRPNQQTSSQPQERGETNERPGDKPARKRSRRNRRRRPSSGQSGKPPPDKQ